jgi:uncharacterized protein (UPF0248 family)
VVHPLKNILNRLRWDERENPERYVITYRHRGAPDDVLRIPASKIANLGKSYFTILESLEAGSEETVIPFHRVLEIRNVSNGRVIWIKKESASIHHDG